jgi:hypothetical protein
MSFDPHSDQEPRLRGAMIAACAFILAVCGLRIGLAYRAHAEIGVDVALAYVLGGCFALPSLLSALFWREPKRPSELGRLRQAQIVLRAHPARDDASRAGASR